MVAIERGGKGFMGFSLVIRLGVPRECGVCNFS